VAESNPRGYVRWPVSDADVGMTTAKEVRALGSLNQRRPAISQWRSLAHAGLIDGQPAMGHDETEAS
jgi:hypothetical protein